ncbi:hypothetical protein MTO96_014755 [Rhipicephalus appendiculatus]
MQLLESLPFRLRHPWCGSHPHQQLQNLQLVLPHVRRCSLQSLQKHHRGLLFRGPPAKTVASTGPLCVTRAAGESSSSGESLSELVNKIEMITSKAAQPKESNAQAGVSKEESMGKHTGTAKTSKQQPVEKPLTTPPRRSKRTSTPSKRTPTPVTPRQQGPETRRGKASREASPCKIELFAEVAEAPTTARAQRGSARASKNEKSGSSLKSRAQISTKSSLASPAAKKRKFFKSRDSDWDAFFLI